jgi:hypothetical protein
MLRCARALFDKRLVTRQQVLPRITRGNQSMSRSACTAPRRGVFQELRLLAACRRLLILAAAALVLASSPLLSTQALAAPYEAAVSVGHAQIAHGGEPAGEPLFCAFSGQALLPTGCFLPIWPDDPPVWRVLPL